MRLNAYLARAGVCSRRNADDLIRQGRVRVNGTVAGLATDVGDADEVELDGKRVSPERLVAVLLHKPAGVVTTARDTHGRPTVVDLVSDVGVRVVPVGRLDADTTGALLLTNDGQLAQRLAHPSYEVDKVYEAFLRSIPTDADLEKLARGVLLEDGLTSPAQVRRLARSVVELTIHEGRNRQVKRMCEAIGHRVVKLHRSVYAGLDVRGLEPGEYRKLTTAELDALRSGVRKASTKPVAKGRLVVDRGRPTAPRRPKTWTSVDGPDPAPGGGAPREPKAPGAEKAPQKHRGAPKGKGPAAGGGPGGGPAAGPTSPAPRRPRGPGSGPSGSGTSAPRGPRPR